MSIKKGSESIDSFFQRIKEVRDRLSSVAVVIDEEELIHLVLEALPQEYGAFCSAIRTRNDVFTLEELNTLLNAEERAIKKKYEARDTSMVLVLQSGFNQNNNRGRGRNGNQKGRGRGFNNFGPNFGFNNGQTSGNPNFGFNSGQSSGTINATPQFPGFQSHSQLKNGGNSSGFHQVQGQSQNSRPTCQICGKNEHTALNCYHLMNFACQGRHAPAKLASMAASSMAALATANFALASNSAWLTDTRCSDHVTQDLSQLSLHS